MRSDEGMGNRYYAGPDDLLPKPIGEEEEIDPVSFPIVDPQTDTKIDDDEPVSFPIVDPQPDDTKDSGS